MAALAFAAALQLPASASSGGAAAPSALSEVPVTPVDLAQETSNNSPALAADPTDSRVIALANRVDAPRFSCRLHLSGDGGRGWSAYDPVPRLPKGAERCYGPEVAFDRRGVLHYLFVGLAGRGNRPVGVYLVTSSNLGRTFSAPRRVLGRNVFQVRLAIEAGADRRDRMHLAWLAPSAPPALGGFPATSNPILAAFSDDGGRTFSAPVQVSDPGRPRVVAPALAIGAGGAVHVLYYDLQGDAVDYQGLEGPTWEGTWSLVASSSTDRGRTFSTGTVVEDQVVPPERVMLIFTMAPPALAAGGRTLVAAWHDARNGDWDVFARTSPDGGRTWEPAVRVNDDATASGHHQYLPRLSISTDGRVDAIFYDRRSDADNVRNEVFWAYSRDGGRTFSPNLRLTTDPSRSTVGARYLVASAAGRIEFGSRLALVSQPGKAVAAWTDTRNSLPGQQQDIFATEVVFPGFRPTAEPDSQRGSPSGPVLAAAAAVFAAAAAVRKRRRGSRRPTEAGV